MSSRLKNLSELDYSASVSLEKIKIGIVVSEWNNAITFALLEGCKDFLINAGVKSENILVHLVPGTYELALGAQLLAESDHNAVVCLGCVIQGETRHFDFICHAAAVGIMEVGLKFNKPVIFGVLTTDNMQQAQDRAGGIHGNKGIEAAATALKMIELQLKLPAVKKA